MLMMIMIINESISQLEDSESATILTFFGSGSSFFDVKISCLLLLYIIVK